MEKYGVPERVPSTKERIAGLDCLRFFAALSVLAYHYLFRGSRDGEQFAVSYGPIGEYFQYAYFGVPLFFMISGFVILWSAENKNWFDFAAGRVVRLWPAYAIGVTLTALVIMLFGGPHVHTSFVHWLTNLTFFAPAFGQNFMDGVYWTIVLEIIFYFWVTVAIMSGLLNNRLLEICLAWMVLIVANEFWLDSGALRLVALTAYGAWFLIGVLCYQLWSKGWSNLIALVLAAAVELALLSAMNEHVYLAGEMNYTVDFASIIIVSLICILLFFATIYWGHKVRASGLVFAMGGMTYPLYLIHQKVGYIMIEGLADPLGEWAALALTTAIMLAVAFAIFRWWERPVAKILKQIILPLGDLVPAVGQKRAAGKAYSNSMT